MKIFSGSSVLNLSHSIANRLYTTVKKASISRFQDGEINVVIEENVRGKNAFVIQSTCFPTNDNLVELIIMVDALRRASVKKITAVIPYFGYSRQDRRISFLRTSVTAKLIADILSYIGIDHIVTVDLHSEQIQSFFNIPIDNIGCNLIFLNDFFQKNISNFIVVSPDIGGIKRAQNFAKMMHQPDIAVIYKKRSRNNSIKMMSLIGNVSNKNCILIDDIIDSGNTLCKAAKFLKKHNAKKVFSYVTHAVFSYGSYKVIKRSSIDQITVCDTIPLNKYAKKIKNIRVLSVSSLLSEVIRRIDKKESVSSMFSY